MSDHSLICSEVPYNRNQRAEVRDESGYFCIKNDVGLFIIEPSILPTSLHNK